MTTRNDFDGTPATILTTTALLGDGEFAVDGSSATIVEFDNSAAADKWTSLDLRYTGAFSADPNTTATIDIYRWETSVDGSNDELAPSVGDENAAKWVGSFKIPGGVTTGTFYLKERISMVGIKKCKFTIKPNVDGVQDISIGATLVVEGFGFNDA